MVQKSNSDESREGAADAARRAAEAAGEAADYVRNLDVQGMLADAQALVRQNPVPALLVAVALGFLVARAVARD